MRESLPVQRPSFEEQSADKARFESESPEAAGLDGI